MYEAAPTYTQNITLLCKLTAYTQNHEKSEKEEIREKKLMDGWWWSKSKHSDPVISAVGGSIISPNRHPSRWWLDKNLRCHTTKNIIFVMQADTRKWEISREENSGNKSIECWWVMIHELAQQSSHLSPASDGSLIYPSTHPDKEKNIMTGDRKPKISNREHFLIS